MNEQTMQTIIQMAAAILKNEPATTGYGALRRLREAHPELGLSLWQNIDTNLLAKESERKARRLVVGDLVTIVETHEYYANEVGMVVCYDNGSYDVELLKGGRPRFSRRELLIR